MPEDLRRRRMRALYSSFLRPGDLAFDIGANHGDRVETFLALGARVVALEPQPHCLEDLKRKFWDREDVTILGAAADERTGRACMLLSNNDTVSSLSKEWIARVRAGGRFEDSVWDREMDVDTVTLDDLIATYGRPDFIKIDVEGSEYQVLRGLHHAVAGLSFEYTPEDISAAVRCIRLIEELGDYRFDLSSGETFVMKLGSYAPGKTAIDMLKSLDARDGDVVSGDVYAVLQKEPREGG